MGIDALLHLTHALEETMPVAKLRIDLITRGAQPAGEHMGATNVAQAPSIGIFRVILGEHPNFSCRGIDLPTEVSAADRGLLWGELLHADTEREVALRGEARYVQRISRGLPHHEVKLDSSIPLRLESRERGLLDSLRFTPFELPKCAPGEILVQVKAAGMNFRDVLKALALYPAETADARIFGDEVAGEVVAVGEGVTHLAVGDKAFGLAVFGLATHTLARAADMRKMPENLSYEEAATLPVVFMTAWYALNNVARMKKGESILVHAGAGGVGMAAIQIAHHLGAEVIASAGSPTKRALLKTLGVKHVIDSRRGDFAESVMELTHGRGVDVVLNALAAEAIPMGLSCLAESGRFLEIGKRDIYMNSRIPLWGLRRNSSFHVIAMDAIFAGDEAQTRDLLAEIAVLVDQGALTPLPFRSFPASRIDAAFRLMAGGKHTGKVVVGFADSFIVRKGEAPLPPFEIKAEGSYLITGGLGGFGRVLAEWLVTCGARHLVLEQPQRCLHAGSRGICRQPRSPWHRDESAESGHRLAEGCEAPHFRNPGSQGDFPPRDGHRRRTAFRADRRAAPHGDGTESAWRVVAPRSHARPRSRRLRDVLLGFEHLRKPGARELLGGQRLPRLARLPSPRARPTGARDQLGRARRRRLCRSK